MSVNQELRFSVLNFPEAAFIAYLKEALKLELEALNQSNGFGIDFKFYEYPKAQQNMCLSRPLNALVKEKYFSSKFLSTNMKGICAHTISINLVDEYSSLLCQGNDQIQVLAFLSCHAINDLVGKSSKKIITDLFSNDFRVS